MADSSHGRLARVLVPLAALVALTPWASAAVALFLGAAMALTVGNPYIERSRRLTHPLLSLAVVGLGAGMDLRVVGRVGAHGIGYTFAGIVSTLTVGWLLGRLLGVERPIATLIGVGTAICGGSAIAAVAPAIGAKHHEVSVALGTVFLLNAIALFIFPPIGHALQLSESQFGLWSALAVHDTSSVVGATLQYGPTAVQVGTTVKLARALWIIPVTLVIGQIYRRGGDPQATSKPRRPWFIAGFLLAAALVTYVPALQPAGKVVELAAKQLLVFTLFLIGVNLTRATLRSVGARPLVQGVLLWGVVAGTTLTLVSLGWVG